MTSLKNDKSLTNYGTRFMPSKAYSLKMPDASQDEGSCMLSCWDIRLFPECPFRKNIQFATHTLIKQK